MILFLLMLAVVAIGVMLLFLGFAKDDGWHEHPLIVIGSVVTAISGAIVLCLLVMHIYDHVAAEKILAERQQEYKVLVYQLEENVYENDNDIGKSELFEKIEKWNTRLAADQALQDNIWIGFIYADIYDQLDFIEFPTGGEK